MLTGSHEGGGAVRVGEADRQGALGHVREDVPALEDVVEVPAGSYPLGEPGEERVARIERMLLHRYPVTNAQLRWFVASTGRRVDAALAHRLSAPHLADHPATGVTFADAQAICAWATTILGRQVRLPTGAEWEAAARGDDGRPWPWGAVFDPERCASAEAGAWTTAPVTAHPAGASPCGAEQLSGNVWEWVADPTEDGDWRAVRGGSHLDHAWGVRASRVLSADPRRATLTTGFRIAIDPDPEDKQGRLR